MIESISGRVRQWLERLPKAWLVAGVSVLGVVVIFASLGMYRVYDYVQHDNDFCTQCHLMSGPFVRFEKSAHRGLGCKACHRPNIWQRSKMGLTQIIEMPDSISQHAEVPRRICAECHVQGNPEEWKQIANSVGHRVHLESNNPSLKDIECVTCHSAGIHEFSPSDKTCGQAGCHESQDLQLGKMSKLTIHCASCHDFTKPISRTARGDTLKKQLTPRGNDCLSCHSMRERLNGSFPAHEPHGGVCGSCHNPHEQKTPAEAVRSCMSAGCHERADTISPMHRRLGPDVMQNCTRCHQAHTWKTKGTECTSCHTPESLDSGKPGLIKQINAVPAHQSVFDAVLAPLHLIQFLARQTTPVTPPFKHAPHKGVACTACHQSDDGHGVIRIRTAADCQGCHHSQKNAQRCSTCHTASKLQKPLPRTLTIKAAKETRTRTVNFSHERHGVLGCTSCHTKSTDMRNVPSCASCHDDHHTELRNCTSCHTETRAVKAHTRRVHVTCSGSGCHQTTVNTSLRAQRNVCLACHTTKANHEPGGDCATCHMIPNKSKSARASK